MEQRQESDYDEKGIRYNDYILKDVNSINSKYKNMDLDIYVRQVNTSIYSIIHYYNEGFYNKENLDSNLKELEEIHEIEPNRLLIAPDVLEKTFDSENIGIIKQISEFEMKNEKQRYGELKELINQQITVKELKGEDSKELTSILNYIEQERANSIIEKAKKDSYNAGMSEPNLENGKDERNYIATINIDIPIPEGLFLTGEIVDNAKFNSQINSIISDIDDYAIENDFANYEIIENLDYPDSTKRQIRIEAETSSQLEEILDEFEHQLEYEDFEFETTYDPLTQSLINQKSNAIIAKTITVPMPSLEEFKSNPELAQFIAGNNELGFYIDKEHLSQYFQNIYGNVDKNDLNTENDFTIDAGFVAQKDGALSDKFSIYIEANKNDFEQVINYVQENLDNHNLDYSISSFDELVVPAQTIKLDSKELNNFINSNDIYFADEEKNANTNEINLYITAPKEFVNDLYPNCDAAEIHINFPLEKFNEDRLMVEISPDFYGEGCTDWNKADVSIKDIKRLIAMSSFEEEFDTYFESMYQKELDYIPGLTEGAKNYYKGNTEPTIEGLDSNHNWWKITKGGYDLAYQIYKNNIPVIDIDTNNNIYPLNDDISFNEFKKVLTSVEKGFNTKFTPKLSQDSKYHLNHDTLNIEIKDYEINRYIPTSDLLKDKYFGINNLSDSVKESFDKSWKKLIENELNLNKSYPEDRITYLNTMEDDSIINLFDDFVKDAKEKNLAFTLTSEDVQERLDFSKYDLTKEQQTELLKTLDVVHRTNDYDVIMLDDKLYIRDVSVNFNGEFEQNPLDIKETSLDDLIHYVAANDRGFEAIQASRITKEQLDLINKVEQINQQGIDMKRENDVITITEDELKEINNNKENLVYLCSFSSDKLIDIANDMKVHNDKTLGERMNRVSQEILNEQNKKNNMNNNYNSY